MVNKDFCRDYITWETAILDVKQQHTKLLIPYEYDYVSNTNTVKCATEDQKEIKYRCWLCVR